MSKLSMYYLLFPMIYSQPLTQFQLDGAVAHITDGQRELMAMLDNEYQAKYAVNFWDTLSGSVTVGAMLMIIGLTVGVSVICCWLRCQWSEVIGGIERTYAARIRSNHNTSSALAIIESRTRADARTSALLMTTTDAPPSYTDLFQN